MQDNYLNLAQNTCAARIFLNTFGFTIENVNDVSESSKIKVFDKEMNVAGKLYFDNGKVMIEAGYDNGILEANYDIPKMSDIIDRDCGNALFSEWKSVIKFKAKNIDKLKLSGEFLIDCTVDSEFGIKCKCHPLIKCEVPKKGEATLKILRDFSVFELNIQSGECEEKIRIRPSDYMNGFLIHKITIGEYNKEIHDYPYKKYAGIFCESKSKDKLHVFLIEKKDTDIISYHNEWLPITEEKEYWKGVIQKGLLMQNLDPEMYERLQQLRQILTFWHISLLDNLISVCYDRYTDEALEALLGMKRIKMNYQDGADNLKESYFSLGKESRFLLSEQQKNKKRYRLN